MLQRATPLTPRDDDRPKGLQVVRGTKLERKPKGGLKAKEGRVSIGPKEEKKNERTKEERRNKKKR